MRFCIVFPDSAITLSRHIASHLYTCSHIVTVTPSRAEYVLKESVRHRRRYSWQRANACVISRSDAARVLAKSKRCGGVVTSPRLTLAGAQ